MTFDATRTRERRGRATPALLAPTLVGFPLAAWLAPMPAGASDPAPRSDASTALAACTILTVFAWWTASTRDRA